ncbi:MAG: hypothetical protein GF401_07135 [Chitinivibrionales bacterium]|nr:hypothetical protein [Chitinivibrionales bacterium]
MNTALRTIFAFIYPAIVFITVPSADNTPVYVIPLDGVNEVHYNHEFPLNTPDAYSVLYADVFDRRSIRSLFDSSSSESTLFSRYDTSAHVSLWMRVGAEVGDNLLNLTGPQRDHFDNIGISWNIPKAPVSLLARYRYFDQYSDRFNSLWGAYPDSDGQPMKYYDEGLVKDITGAYRYAGQALYAEGSLKKYGYWGATPYYFTPLHRSGYATEHFLSFDFDFARTDIAIAADFQNWYYDHQTPEEIIYPRISAAWKQPFADEYVGSLTFNSTPRLTPATNLKAAFADTAADPFFWNAKAGIYENGQPEAEVKSGAQLSPRFTVETAFLWDYFPRDENYEFTAFSDTICYHYTGFHGLAFHGSLFYADTLLFPFECKAWYDYNQNQLWEILDTSGSPVIIRQEPSEDKISSVGGAISYDISFPMISLDLWANGHYFVSGDKERLNVPWNLGMDLTLGKQDNQSIVAALSLQAVGPVTLGYKHLPDHSLETFNAPAHTDLYFMFKIPFISPIWTDHIQSTVMVEAGPVHLDVPKRIQKHPLGNRIGPVVSVRLNASFL